MQISAVVRTGPQPIDLSIPTVVFRRNGRAATAPNLSCAYPWLAAQTAAAPWMATFADGPSMFSARVAM